MTDQPQDTAGVEEAAAVDGETVGGDIPGRDGEPQDSAAMQAAEGLTPSSDVSATYEDMLERSAAQRGEGRVP